MRRIGLIPAERECGGPRGTALDGFRANLGLDLSLIDQHDGDVVLHRIDPAALLTLQTFRILAVLQRLYACRTNQVFQ